MDGIRCSTISLARSTRSCARNGSAITSAASGRLWLIFRDRTGVRVLYWPRRSVDPSPRCERLGFGQQRARTVRASKQGGGESSWRPIPVGSFGSPFLVLLERLHLGQSPTPTRLGSR